jgi:HSP20 family protein
LIPWRPFGETSQWDREMERMFGDFLGGNASSLYERLRPEGSFRIGAPAVDLYEEKDEIVVKAELPGMTKDDIQINITDKLLTLRGERKQEDEKEEKNYYRSERLYGAFGRTLPLPVEIKPEKAHATFKNGVLEIRLPKSEEAKKKAIKVKVEA